LEHYIIIANKYPAGKHNEKLENSKLVIFDSPHFRLMRFDCTCIKTIYPFKA
jgi:hypothetical protein